MKIFCKENHKKIREKAENKGWDDAKQYYKSEFDFKKHQIFNNCMDSLREIEGKINLAVKVETDSSQVIQRIFAELQYKPANMLLGEAKEKLKELLN